MVKKICRYFLFVLTQSTNVTDGQTHSVTAKTALMHRAAKICPQLRSVTPVEDSQCRQNQSHPRDTGIRRGSRKTSKSGHNVCVGPVETRLVVKATSCPWETPLMRRRPLSPTSSKRQAETDDRIPDTRTPWILEVVDSSSRPDHVPVRMTTNWRLEAVGDWLKM